MKEKLIKKIYENGLYLIFGMQTFIFGLYLLFNPNTFSAKGAYSIIAELLNEESVSFILMAVGVFNIVLIVFEKTKLKAIGLAMMQFIWSVFFFAFLIKQVSGFPTTGWILILGLILAMAHEGWRGEFD